MHKSRKFVGVSTPLPTTTIIEQLGDPTRGKLPAGRRATEKGAEQTGEVLVLDDGGGLHSLTPQLHTLCTRRQVVCRRENIKIQGACEMGNGIG